jgi:hypothetical protein
VLDIQIDRKLLSRLAKDLVDLPGQTRRATISALKSTAYNIQQDLKRQGRSGAGWPPRNPHSGVLSRANNSKLPLAWKKTRWKHGSKHGGKKGHVIQRRSMSTTPFPKLANAIRYTVSRDDLVAMMGFINSKLHFWIWMTNHARGFKTKVTPRMRRMAFALGMPIGKDKTEIETPARPWIEPVQQKWKWKATGFFETRFWKALNRHRSGSRIKD